LLRLVRAARRLPAHARPLHGRPAQARRAHHPALLDRRSAAGLRRSRVGAQRPRRDRVLMANRILVVDDQRSNVEMMAGLLKARGHDVLTALDGKTALETVRVSHPDLVVSDILMPGIDGYELCRRLRA